MDRGKRQSTVLFALVALIALCQVLTTISADTDVMGILSAAEQRRTRSSEQAKDQVISAQPNLTICCPRPNKQPWHGYGP